MRTANCSGSMAIKSRYCLTYKKRNRLLNSEEKGTVKDKVLVVANLQQGVQTESRVHLAQGLSRTTEEIRSFANLECIYRKKFSNGETYVRLNDIGRTLILLIHLDKQPS